MKPASTTRSGCVGIDRCGQRRIECRAIGKVAVIDDAGRDALRCAVASPGAPWRHC